ncbi:MAG: hypothetical protein AAF430_21370 [Myxococcota bacterium]
MSVGLLLMMAFSSAVALESSEQEDTEAKAKPGEVVPASVAKATVDMVDTFVRREAERESARNQSENAVVADASTAVVERSSVSDFIGVGLALAGLQAQSGDEERATSASATISAAALGSIPLGRSFDDAWFDERSFWRNVAFTIGYDDPEDNDIEDATILGVEVRLISDGQTWWGKDPFQFAPAVLLDAPARAVFRPQDVNLGSWWAADAYFKDEIAAEKKALDQLVAQGRSFDWGNRVCNWGVGNTSRAQQERDLGFVGFFFRSSASQERLEQPLEFATNYMSWLLCQDPDSRTRASGEAKPAGFVALLKPDMKEEDREQLEALLKSEIGEVETKLKGAPKPARLGLAFNLLLDRAAQASEEEPEPEVPMANTAPPQPDVWGNEEAFRTLDRLEDDKLAGKVLTTFGRAVRLWALGKKRESLELLKKYIEQHSEQLGPKRKDRLKAVGGSLVGEMNKRTELSIDFDSKLRNGGDDEFSVKMILEASPLKDCDTHLGLAFSSNCNYFRYLNFTLNAGVDYIEQSRDDDSVGGFAGVEMQIPVSLDSIWYGTEYSPTVGQNDPMFSLSGLAKWQRNMGDSYVGQAKLEIPIAGGIKVPISVSVANRTELVQERETEVRGIVGFTIDTNLLANALSTGLVAE